jgi:hypothetical protein
LGRRYQWPLPPSPVQLPFSPCPPSPPRPGDMAMDESKIWPPSDSGGNRVRRYGQYQSLRAPWARRTKPSISPAKTKGMRLAGMWARECNPMPLRTMRVSPATAQRIALSTAMPSIAKVERRGATIRQALYSWRVRSTHVGKLASPVELAPECWIICHIEYGLHFSVLHNVGDTVNHDYLVHGVLRGCCKRP